MSDEPRYPLEVLRGFMKDWTGAGRDDFSPAELFEYLLLTKEVNWTLRKIWRRMVVRFKVKVWRKAKGKFTGERSYWTLDELIEDCGFDPKKIEEEVSAEFRDA